TSSPTPPHSPRRSSSSGTNPSPTRTAPPSVPGRPPTASTGSAGSSTRSTRWASTGAAWRQTWPPICSASTHPSRPEPPSLEHKPVTASTPQTTRATLERMYEAAQAGDMTTLGSLMHPEVRVEEPPFLPYGGTYTGLDDFVGVFARASETIKL